jgi:hypothetical protein
LKMALYFCAATPAAIHDAHTTATSAAAPDIRRPLLISAYHAMHTERQLSSAAAAGAEHREEVAEAGGALERNGWPGASFYSPALVSPARRLSPKTFCLPRRLPGAHTGVPQARPLHRHLRPPAVFGEATAVPSGPGPHASPTRSASDGRGRAPTDEFPSRVRSGPSARHQPNHMTFACLNGRGRTPTAPVPFRSVPFRSGRLLSPDDDHALPRRFGHSSATSM